MVNNPTRGETAIISLAVIFFTIGIIVIVYFGGLNEVEVETETGKTNVDEHDIKHDEILENQRYLIEMIEVIYDGNS